MERFPDEPLIVFSMPRSGSTLLLRLLNESGVTLYGENGDILWPLKRVWDCWEEVDSHGGFAPYDAKQFQPWWNRCDRDELREAIKTMVSTWGYSGATRRWGFKEIRYGIAGPEPFGCLLDWFFGEIFPSGQAIFLLREPNDCADSMLRSGYFSGARRELESRCSTQQEALIAGAERLGGRAAIMCYESFVTSYDYCAAALSRVAVKLERSTYLRVLALRLG